jgi:hypothetical protein
MIDFRFENHMKYIHVLCWLEANYFHGTGSSTYSNRSALNVKSCTSAEVDAQTGAQFLRGSE